MVQVVWRGRRRRMELEGRGPSRGKRAKAPVTSADGAESAEKPAAFQPVRMNPTAKMLRYRASKLAETEGVAFEVAVATLEAGAAPVRPAAQTAVRSKPKRHRTDSGTMKRLAKKFGSKRKAKGKGQKKKSKSYPFFLFLQGGAPGLGKKS